MTPDIDFLKSEVAYYMQRLYRRKLTTTLGGNISIKAGQLMIITPSQKDKDRLTANDMVVVDLLTATTLTTQQPSMEYRFHMGIYATRGDVEAIIHAHPFWGTWLAITGTQPKINLLDESLYFLKNVAFCNYAPMGTEMLATEVSKNAQSSDVLILKNHGVITMGKSLCEALEKMEVLENIAHYTYISAKLKS